jgi:hypothetical protein
VYDKKLQQGIYSSGVLLGQKYRFAAVQNIQLPEGIYAEIGGLAFSSRDRFLFQLNRSSLFPTRNRQIAQTGTEIPAAPTVSRAM